MDPQVQVDAPIEVSTGEAFDRDYSDLDVPGFESEESDSTPAAIEASEAEETVLPKTKEEELDEREPEQEKADIVAAPAAGTAKKVAFKGADGKPIELQEDAVVEWKVDGKATPVPLKELLTNYSGKVAWEKRFNEVAEQRKQFAEVSRSFEAERGRHKAVINEMHKAASEGRTFDAVSAMLKLSGAQASPREYLSNLRNGLIKQAQEMSQMSPEQRQLQEEREEVAYLKAQGLQAQQQREQEQAEKQFQERVVKAIGSVNSTFEEYVSTRDFLLDQGPKLLGNQWDPKQVTPEYVANQIRDVRDYRTAREALDAVDPALSKKDAVWKQAVDMLRSNPDWSAEDLKDVYRQAMKEKRSVAISKKVAKSPVATTATASRKTTPVKSSREDYSSFDESDATW